MILKCGNQFLHVLAWSGKQYPFMFPIEVLLQLLRDILRISHKDAIEVLIEFQKDFGAMGIGGRESNCE